VISAPEKVGVVLLNWNGGEFTIPCIESLLKGTSKPWKILVFDNGSTDDSPDRIAKQFGEVELIRNGRNIGFAEGNNVPIRRLVAEGADLIWVLNNDTLVAPDCLEKLVAAMRADPGVAAASAKILFEDPRDLIWYAGAFWRPIALRAPHRGLREKDIGQHDEPCDVGFLSGCCMLVRAEVYRRIGDFRGNYFIYNEDTEWCRRATEAGLRMRYVPQAVLWHKQHATTRKNFTAVLTSKAPPLQEYYQTRNSLFLAREHARRPWQFMATMTDNLIRRLYRAGGLLLLGRAESTLAILRGIRDGLRDPYR
jgi:GT2 family glycosyltransferase